MQGYGEVFARVYNLRWGGFAQRIAPALIAFYGNTEPGQQKKPVLDLCCGTGQLAVAFLEQNFHVTGIDLSEYMLKYARENAASYIEAGQAYFMQGDATDFTLDEPVGLTVSTYDALNHLDDEDALRRCFQCVAAVTEGYFIFDLNTRLGLKRWNGMMLSDTEEVFLMNKGIYEVGMEKAWTAISGFLRNADGLYERFEETTFNTVFDMARVKKLLLETGWNAVYYARIDDLTLPIEDPEQEQRVFFVAQK